MILKLNGKDVEFEKGNEFYTASCPFHGGSGKTLFYKDGIYECVLCGAAGRTEDAAPEEKDDWDDDIGRLTDNVVKERIYALNEDACQLFERTLHGKWGVKGKEYLDARKLSAETIRSFRLGYARDKMPLEQMLARKGYTKKEMALSGLFNENDDGTLWFAFQARVMYPITDEEGRIIGFGGRLTTDGEPKYKNSPETVVFSKREHLFAYDRARKSGRRYLILCEGYMDVISMHQAGFTNAVASLGTAFTEEQAALIRNEFRQAVLLYDTDVPGRKATDRAIEILKKTGIRTFVSDSLPAKDPDEFLKRFGKEKFAGKIKSALTADEHIVKTAMDKGEVEKAADFLFMQPVKKVRHLLDKAAGKKE